MLDRERWTACNKESYSGTSGTHWGWRGVPPSVPVPDTRAHLGAIFDTQRGKIAQTGRPPRTDPDRELCVGDSNGSAQDQEETLVQPPPRPSSMHLDMAQPVLYTI